MANEAVLIYETEIPIPFTCADGATIEKGAILKLSDPMTASISTANDDIVAGICAGEKIINNGETKVAVYRKGIFRVTASGSITVGDTLGTSLDSTNLVYSNSAGANLSGSKCLGVALETATNGETFLMELNVSPIKTL